MKTKTLANVRSVHDKGKEANKTLPKVELGLERVIFGVVEGDVPSTIKWGLIGLCNIGTIIGGRCQWCTPSKVYIKESLGGDEHANSF